VTKSGICVHRMCGRSPPVSSPSLTVKVRIVVFCTPAMGTPSEAKPLFRLF
jgi:hypothetical protein